MSFIKNASVLLVMMLFGFGFSSKESNAQTVKTGSQKNLTQKKEKVIVEQTDSISNPALAELFADNVNLKDKKKIKDLATAVNKSLGYNAYTEEELKYPAIDLYGETSWHNKAVNPYISGVHAIVPDSFSIDLSQFTYPADNLKRITSNYGYRRRFGRMHYGIDLKVQVGDTIRAAFDGKVRMVDYERRGFGKYVVIRHPNGLETLYAHCSKHLVSENDIVRAGDPIALGGNTGRSTGSHLHFEARFMGQPINPSELIDFTTGIPRSKTYVFEKSDYKVSQGKIVARKTSSNGGNIKLHRIKEGDTLSEIAKRYGTTVSKLCKINGISKTKTLKIGSSIRVNG